LTTVTYRAHSWIDNNIISLIKCRRERYSPFRAREGETGGLESPEPSETRKKKELNKIYSPNAKQKKLDGKRLIQRGQKEEMTKERLQGG